MKMTDHRKLLAQYATMGSEEAFRELVTRYLSLVYSTAMRLVNGDAHLAEDVVQTVFADLPRLAGTLSADVMLGGEEMGCNADTARKRVARALEKLRGLLVRLRVWRPALPAPL